MPCNMKYQVSPIITRDRKLKKLKTITILIWILVPMMSVIAIVNVASLSVSNKPVHLPLIIIIIVALGLLARRKAIINKTS